MDTGEIAPCKAHESEQATRRGIWACTCSGVMLFKCEGCGRYAVPEKLRGIGYVCDACMDAGY